MSDNFIFFVLMSISAEHEARFNELYDTDHLPTMVSIPGVRDAARYKLQWSDNADMQTYLCMYHLEHPELPRLDIWARHGAMGRWPIEMRHLATQRSNCAMRQIFHADAAGRANTVDSFDNDFVYFLQQGIPARLDARFNELYNTDHIPLMLQASGVSGCTRYEALYSPSKNVPDYLAVYGVDGVDVPRSPEWKAQTQKGAWPTEMRPHFTARRNGVYRRVGVFKNRS
jgi:hypothetical protein